MRKQRQTHGEEVANVLTHGAGMLFGLTAIVVLMIAGIRTGDPWVIGSFAVYALCMTSSYVTSTFYHAASDPKRKCQLRRWDHSAIYLHIAGTYTPFTLVAPAGRLLGLVTIRRHMDRGSGRGLAEFPEDEKERPSENGLLSADELGGDYRFQTIDRCFPAYGFDVCLILVDRRRLVLFLRNDFFLSG